MLDVGGAAVVVGVDSLLLWADSDSRCSSGGSASVDPGASSWLTWVGSASGGTAISTAWTVNDVFEKLETMISARHLPFLPGSTPSETSHPLGCASGCCRRYRRGRLWSRVLGGHKDLAVWPCYCVDVVTVWQAVRAPLDDRHQYGRRAGYHDTVTSASTEPSLPPTRVRRYQTNVRRFRRRPGSMPSQPRMLQPATLI